MSPNPALDHAVLEAFREEIGQRYSLDNLRSHEPLADIDDEYLIELRDFLLDNLYPEAERRGELDEAFDHLHALLRSPRQLKPLMRTALASMWRLGRHLPGAISAGLRATEALRETRKLERQLIDAAAECGFAPEDFARREALAKTVARIPEDIIRRLVAEVIDLFTALSDVKTLTAMCQIMERALGVMETKPDTYDDQQRLGVALALQVVRGGLDLFERLTGDQFKRILETFERVELRWYDAMRREAAT
ncbi:MAG: hypothetical protein GWP08_20550 [Nitrospiraceae bacterium]|nr:hypothetical protein [Nitrospiraceae bacterium]